MACRVSVRVVVMRPRITTTCYRRYRVPIVCVITDNTRGTSMIIVTGATGALNGRTVDHLLEHVTPADVAVVTRDVARAERFARAGVEVRQGDYADPASLPAAYAGADQLLLVSSNDPA